jgi:hypothetical protein
MRIRVAVVVALFLAVAGLRPTRADAQRQGEAGPAAEGRGRGRGGTGAEFAGPPQGPNALPIVEVVGCLAQSGNLWMMTNATEPTRATAGWSRPEEVKAAETKPLGSLQLPLIGLVELSPADHKGHKVVVKGLLIKDAAGNRLNVTSLMTATTACR